MEKHAVDNGYSTLVAEILEAGGDENTDTTDAGEDSSFATTPVLSHVHVVASLVLLAVVGQFESFSP